jgi:hypothetical protein
MDSKNKSQGKVSTLSFLEKSYKPFQSEIEFEETYVSWMRDLYGSNDWCYCVQDTPNDCIIAMKHRRNMYERNIKNPQNTGQYIDLMNNLKRAIEKDMIKYYTKK